MTEQAKNTIVKAKTTDPHVASYALPSDTLQDRTFTMSSLTEATKVGFWAARLFNAKGVARLMFNPVQDVASGKRRDGVTIIYVSPEAKEASRHLAEAALLSYAQLIDPKTGEPTKPRLSLYNLPMNMTNEGIESRTKAYIEAGDEPRLAITRMLIDVFNETVAGPDGGEMRLLKKDGDVAYIEGTGSCSSSCLESSARNLKRIFETYPQCGVKTVKFKAAAPV